MRKNEIITVFFVSMLVNLLIQLLLPIDNKYLLTIISEIFGIFLPAFILIRMREKRFLEFFPIKGIRFVYLILIIYGFCIFSIPYMYFSSLIEKLFGMPGELLRTLQEFASFNADLGHNLWVVFAIVLVPAVAEEFLFRGFLQTCIHKYLRPAETIILVSLLFTFIHLNPWWSIQIFILSLVISYIRFRTGSIIPCIIIHLLNNLFSVLMNTYFYA